MTSLRYSGPSNFYRELAELPVPTSATFLNTTATSTSSASVVRVSYSIRDHERNVKRSVTKTLTLGAPSLAIDSPVISSTISQDSSEAVAFLSAPSGKRHAILREVSDTNGGKKRYVEVWSGIQLEASQEVTKKHGQFHTDDYLKSFSFTPSETALVYTAEANATEEREEDPYPKFRFTPSFGELLYTKRRPVLFVFRWRPQYASDTTDTASSVTALSLDQSPNIPVVFGQATFVTETRLYATGYEQTADGKLLGIRACFNRPSSIWELILPRENLEKVAVAACKSVKIHTPGLSYRSPRVLFDKDGAPISLFWLSNPSGGAHASTVSLYVRDLKGDAGDRLLVDVVHDPSDQEFPGLYTEHNLNDSPFIRLGERTYVLVQSLWRSRVTLLLINVENGDVVDLTPLNCQTLYSWNLLGTDGASSVICSRSTPTTPPETVLLTLTQGRLLGNVHVLDRPSISPQLQKAIDRLDAQVIPIPSRYPVETIVIRSKDSVQGHKPFCLTYPHGGPHASTVTSFSAGVLAYALEGYTISLLNYTGSMGYGEKYIQKLLGKCGTLDVEDCIATVSELINLGLSEPGRQIVQGGSHGGFLAAHLIGQHPDTFSAAVLRNPVISVGEFCTSDIPDWAFREFGLPFEPSTHVAPDCFATLYAASPIAHVDRVKTPVLLLIGEDDLRVPPMQGKGYYHALKGRGRAVDMLVFPKESHPIDGVEAARVSYEAGRDWFRAFTGGQ